MAFTPTNNTSTVTSSASTITATGQSRNSDYSTTTVTGTQYFEFTTDAQSVGTIVGLIGATQSQPTGANSYNSNGYKFLFQDNFNYSITKNGANAVTGLLYGAGDKFSIEIDGTNRVTMKRNGFTVFTEVFTPTDTQYKIAISSNGLALRTLSNVVWGNTNTIITNCQGADSDGDGTPNSLELDSDNDGCSDAYEAGVTTDPAFTHFPNTNVGANGFENSLETASESGIYNSSYTYHYAINSNLNRCDINTVDSDGDTIPDITDIDDDNDGVLDIVETGPFSCGDGIGRTISWDWESEKTLSSAYAYFANKPEYRPLAGPGITILGAGGAWRAMNVDNDGTLANAITLGEYQYAQFTTKDKGILIDSWLYYIIVNTSTNPQTMPKMGILIDDDPNFGSPVVLNDGLAVIQPYATVNTYEKLVHVSNPTYLKPFTTYYVRFYDLNFGTNFKDVSHDQIGLGFQAVPTGTVCSNDIDTDNDGIPNRLDLDSDGDSCPDSVEAGVVNKVGSANTSTGTVVNTSANGGTQTNVSQAIVGNGLPALVMEIMVSIQELNLTILLQQLTQELISIINMQLFQQ
ncbi:hypothetical protein [Chryseobacterium indoltheticum]|uniref:hypothetical protein n=1 Tax=Chryseobacterium indoltheticum TaxID=254 RepID=UPI003F4963F1